MVCLYLYKMYIHQNSKFMILMEPYIYIGISKNIILLYRFVSYSEQAQLGTRKIY